MLTPYLKKAILFASVLMYQIAFSQKDLSGFYIIDTAIFQDASNHWYGIDEKGKVIQPKPNQPRHRATDLYPAWQQKWAKEKNVLEK